VTEAHLLDHLEIEHGALLDALRLDQLVHPSEIAECAP